MDHVLFQCLVDTTVLYGNNIDRSSHTLPVFEVKECVCVSQQALRE